MLTLEEIAILHVFHEVDYTLSVERERERERQRESVYATCAFCIIADFHTIERPRKPRMQIIEINPPMRYTRGVRLVSAKVRHPERVSMDTNGVIQSNHWWGYSWKHAYTVASCRNLPGMHHLPYLDFMKWRHCPALQSNWRSDTT